MICLVLPQSVLIWIWDPLFKGYFLIFSTYFSHPNPLIKGPSISMGRGSPSYIEGQSFGLQPLFKLWAIDAMFESWVHEPFSCLGDLAKLKFVEQGVMWKGITTPRHGCITFESYFNKNNLFFFISMFLFNLRLLWYFLVNHISDHCIVAFAL